MVIIPDVFLKLPGVCWRNTLPVTVATKSVVELLCATARLVMDCQMAALVFVRDSVAA